MRCTGIVQAFVAAGLDSAAACTGAGSGVGARMRGWQRFRWSSSDGGLSGTMSAWLITAGQTIHARFAAS